MYSTHWLSEMLSLFINYLTSILENFLKLSHNFTIITPRTLVAVKKHEN